MQIIVAIISYCVSLSSMLLVNRGRSYKAIMYACVIAESRQNILFDKKALVDSLYLEMLKEKQRECKI